MNFVGIMYFDVVSFSLLFCNMIFLKLIAKNCNLNIHFSLKRLGTE